jgi:hypothetical protein
MSIRFTRLLLALFTLSCGVPGAKPAADASMGADAGMSGPDAPVSADLGSPFDGSSKDAGVDASYDPTNLTATWRGDFTAAVSPGNTLWLEVVLTHEDTAISGTFASQNGRAGTISGTIEGATMTSEMVFTDDCAGTATSTMEVAMDGGRLVGTYLSTDCYGELPGAVDGAYDGTVDLLRQP